MVEQRAQPNRTSNARETNRHPALVSHELIGVLADDRRDSRAAAVTLINEHREQRAAVARLSPASVNRMPETMCRVRAAEAARALPQAWMAS